MATEPIKHPSFPWTRSPKIRAANKQHYRGFEILNLLQIGVVVVIIQLLLCCRDLVEGAKAQPWVSSFLIFVLVLELVLFLSVTFLFFFIFECLGIDWLIDLWNDEFWLVYKLKFVNLFRVKWCVLCIGEIGVFLVQIKWYIVWTNWGWIFTIFLEFLFASDGFVSFYVDCCVKVYWEMGFQFNF